jgi:hypothetical protein
MPLAVLIDAGPRREPSGRRAIQDHDRGAVLGRPRSVAASPRSTFRLRRRRLAQSTTALWITPSGRQIQRPPRTESGDTCLDPRSRVTGSRAVGWGGIVPDRQIAATEQTDLALTEARRVLMRASSRPKSWRCWGSRVTCGCPPGRFTTGTAHACCGAAESRRHRRSPVS